MKLVCNRSLCVSAIFVLGFHGVAYGHGLMVDPPARNAVCGMAEDQKPHNATNPACVEAFANDKNGGYQFMSVLTHDVGRQGVSPLPANVCGFNSETWDNNNNGNTTPWDLPLDWPTTNVSAGVLDITWNISWGPHFDDTEEFAYYITKPGFQYRVGTALSWNDFESTPFCLQKYDDKNPTQNPDVVANKGATTFKTSCSLPQRKGRHVVYGEWGRNQWTYERFHGCIDVSFDGGDGGGGGANRPPIADSQKVSVDENSSIAITLSGSDRDGTVDSYTVTSDPTNGSLVGSGASQIYTPNINFSGDDAFTFRVTDNNGAQSADATVSIRVNADSAGGNLAPNAAFSYSVSGLGVSFDASQSVDPDNSPQALSYAWNFGDGRTAAGATPSHSYSAAGTYAVELTVSDGQDTDTQTNSVTVESGGGGGDGKVSCEYIISTEWSSGFVAEIRLTNRGSTPVDGWEVSFGYTDGTVVTNGWNSNLVGSGPYSASNLHWNARIEPGDTTTFGVQGTHAGSTEPVEVSGEICGSGDDDDKPTGFSIAPVSVDEGDTGTITIVRHGANTDAASVHISTEMLDGGARAGSDFYGFHEVVQFEAGQSTQQVPIYTLEDAEKESDEVVRVRLFGAEGDVIVTKQALLTIVDDD